MKLLFFKIKKAIASIPDLFKRTRVKAVYEEDLKKLINSLGLSTGIENGQYGCKYCGVPITFDNLQAILKENNEMKFICSRLECITKNI